MNPFIIHDSFPGSGSSHKIEVKEGFKTVAGLSIEKLGDGRWYVHSVMTKEEHRGMGFASQLMDYVEKEYGSFAVTSENDPFWKRMGYRQLEDGYWQKKSRLKIKHR